MNRVFICGFYNFPRGGATSNYVQYLAQVFLKMGKQVIAITNKNLEFKSINSYHDIQIEEIELRKDIIGHYLDFNFRMGSYIEFALSKYKPQKDDIILAYSRDSFVLNTILRCGKKTGARTGICLVEWFERKDYVKGFWDIDYWKSQISLHFLIEKFDYIFPISSYIEDYYKNKGCKTFLLPPLADTGEFKYIKKSFEGKKIFVFPGNGKMKDALKETMLAVSKLNNDEIAQFEFHICGIYEYAHQLVREQKLDGLLNKTIIIHKWMKYEDLVELYQKAHFLLLARDVSRMTKANFPSKIPETLSYGIIPICSRVGDYTKYYLTDGVNSIIMDGCDVDTIVDAIRQSTSITDDKINEMCEQCRKTAVDKFDYRRWVEPIKDFIEKGEL